MRARRHLSRAALGPLSLFWALACSDGGSGAHPLPPVHERDASTDSGAGGATFDASGDGASAAESGGRTFDGGFTADAAAPETRDAALHVGSPHDAGASSDGDTDGSSSVLPPVVCRGPGPRFATRVVSEAFGPGQNSGQDELPGIVLGPPKGGGSGSGSTDVASLGNGGSITLAFDGNAIVDGPGPDFIVFENPFAISGDLANPYAELATVSVSNDGVTWKSFPCTATKYPYGMCAGWHYVYANAATNQIDPTDPATAGGDDFDLADVGMTEARFIRVTDRPDLSSVFDLDAVSIVHSLCE